MKIKLIKILLGIYILTLVGCVKDTNSFPGARVSPYIAMFDLRNIYKGVPVALTQDNMAGSDSITGVVVSDHSGNNLTDSLLVLQDARRLSKLRGMTISVSNASDFEIGDSIVVKVSGGILNRINGTLKVTGLNPSNVRKVSSGNPIAYNKVIVSDLLANPDDYESTEVSIVKAGPSPLPTAPLKLSGSHVLNDAFGNMSLVTNSNAVFADSTLPVLAIYTGIIMDSVKADNSLSPYLVLRTKSDIVTLSSDIKTTPIVISGYMFNPAGSDSNYEYVQLLATQDIDFVETPYSLVTTNNAGTSTPTGYPANGWATGGLRTYKINIATGSVKKGTYFYVGGTNKNIDGAKSTSMESSIWYGYQYNVLAGEGFGSATSNLLANSGNASGIAVFSGTTVTATSEPVDVIFSVTGGSIYSAGPPAKGYLITNTDFYDKVDPNPNTLTSQPYYLSGSNKLNIAYSTATDPFIKLGGVFNTTSGRWTTARSSNVVSLSVTSTVSMIEDATSTKLSE